MEVFEVSKEDRPKRVTIDYDPFTGEWHHIAIQFEHREVSIFHEQIEAFLRMQTILEDIEEIQKLQDRLNQIFPKKP